MEYMIYYISMLILICFLISNIAFSIMLHCSQLHLFSKMPNKYISFNIVHTDHVIVSVKRFLIASETGSSWLLWSTIQTQRRITCRRIQVNYHIITGVLVATAGEPFKRIYIAILCFPMKSKILFCVGNLVNQIETQTLSPPSQLDLFSWIHIFLKS